MQSSMTQDQIAEYLRHPLVGRLATSRDSWPHVVPVWFEFDGTYAWVPSPATSRKVRNIKRNNRVALVVDTFGDDWSEYAQVMIAGTAELLPDTKDLSQTLRIFGRYLGNRANKAEVLLSSKRLIIRIKPARIIAIRGEL